MISLNFARELKDAGLVWRGSINDFFVIPDRGFDDRLFVLSDMQANLDVFRGWPVVTFHGAAEWALDYILTSEVVWMPTESQLRQVLEASLLGEAEKILSLQLYQGKYRCTVYFQEKQVHFDAAKASDAYARALLFVLRQKNT